ncbi:hypothetical protein VIGAN_01024300 [Vigna angularis var. angularis]|uniref:Uncharacterized protein n=1 Tax=Vigna angularis var. angularis TaxID=157739 RepID=A0A0S3QWS4_PHAAN|nr:hypothetical protein VIGAN_01024300 [Vigna angularis var. angularis]
MKTGFHRWSSDDQRNVSDDELDGLDERKVGVVIDEQRGFRGLVSFEVALPLIPSFPKKSYNFSLLILRLVLPYGGVMIMLAWHLKDMLLSLN